MGNQDIVGSKQPTFASEQTQNSTRGFGQNGYAGPSSTTPAQARKVSKTYTSIATPDPVTANAGDWQTRSVAPDQKVKTTPGTRSRNGEGGKVPGSLTRPTR